MLSGARDEVVPPQHMLELWKLVRAREGGEPKSTGTAADAGAKEEEVLEEEEEPLEEVPEEEVLLEEEPDEEVEDPEADELELLPLRQLSPKKLTQYNSQPPPRRSLKVK